MDRIGHSAELGITERLRRKMERNHQCYDSGIKRDWVAKGVALVVARQLQKETSAAPED